ncbi:MAG: two-component sensor histidine kinase [Flavobacteriales bacterium]|nr:MAG: two-component sensor histidine kinase [Flavobacteriales bacterium]
MKPKAITLRTRIYLSMLLLVLVSSVIIGIVTVFHFKSQNEEYHEKRLQRKERAVLAGIGYFLEQYSISDVPKDLAIVLGTKFNELANINKLNINIYDLKGRLLVSAESDSVAIFEPKKQLSPTILTSIDEKGKFIQRVKQNERNFLSSYSIIKDNLEKPLAIIHIPYLERKDVLKTELNSYLIRLGEIYLLLFIGASILAYILSNYITSSLKAVSEKLRTIKIEKKNEPLEWESNDEIGELVEEYNRMLKQLEESAEMLAKSERESAWREMARQVAHEIKNPLTPMKLSVQHLERSWKENDDQWEGKLTRFTKTIIEQIDSLSNIASEFSNFAQMPKAQNEKINIHEILNSAIDLYKETPDVAINFRTDISTEKFVYADKEQLLRVFNNLIKNAIQALPDNQSGKINVVLRAENSSIITEIADNGTGISHEQMEKIFTPNFTTKTGGMGLGLAISKNMVESAKGKIWFVTQKDEGTTFYVSLPEYME